MAKPLDLAPMVREQLLRWRWPIVALASALFIAFEVFEHRSTAAMLVNPNFIRETLIFGVFGPLLAGLTLSLLANTTKERLRAHQRLDLEHELSQQLASANSWEELTALVVRFPRRCLPLIGASLLVRGQEQDQFDLAVEWWDTDGSFALTPTLHRFPGTCQACVSAQSSLSLDLFQCHCFDSAQVPELANRYCLPLVHGDELIGLLYQYFPAGVEPPPNQIDCLNALAPAMALALDGARPDRAAALEAAAIHTERQRIARDLHDTLGQSLGYLHLKLDQLTGDDALKEIVEIRQELERMRRVANESYQQVRRTVAGLHLSTATELATALQERARSIGEQAGFEVELFQEGMARPLDSGMQRHVLYLTREALNNVAKHASAQRVGLYLLWGEDTLSVVLSDDGKGFDLNSCATDGHFGLEFMRERAEEMGGDLSIVSSPGLGTEIVLLIPTTTPIPGSNGGGP